ncbi:MAG: HAMP domain-containing histidine kinase [Coriobacteriia bacterium]|nr:HAMP domain-containing histidine kinase [Coriobacteriia bacterium]
MRNKKTRYGGRISRSILTRFLITLAIYVAAVVVLFYVFSVILSSRFWYPDDPVYIFLKGIESNAFLVLLLVGFVGFVVIFLYYWRKTIGFIDTIVEASQVLVEPGDALIELPPALEQIEIRMNQAKQETQRNLQLAKEAEQRKNDLIVYLAHDIRTPLTSVIGYLSLLDEAPDMPVEQKAKYVHITLDKAHRLEKLIDEFFEITRYNFQTITLIKKDIDLYYMLVQLIDEFYPQLASQGKQAVIHAPETLMAHADPDKLARVFNNIMKNAIAYSDDKSTINITAGLSGAKVSIAFRNVGGIPQDKLATIFERFFRLDDARSSATGGSGLGLAIAKEIVQQHGGQIHAKSSVEDGRAYTTFTVELPLR